MSILRTEIVKKARSIGICSSCLKNKVAKERMQCQRCIDTNQRKRDKKKLIATSKSVNPYRRKVMDYAIRHNICTKCFGRPTTGSIHVTCAPCRERGIPKKKKNPLVGEAKAKQNEYNAKYRKKKKLEKMMKIDKVRMAMDSGKELPSSSL